MEPNGGLLQVAVARSAPPAVSVVIPTYNRAVSLRRLLRAVAASTVPAGGMEVIVVDDGSTDGTAAVVAEAGVRYLSQRNAGPAAARELGWRAAAGNRIVFLDDDVMPEPEAIERLVLALEDADGVGAAILPIDSSPFISHYLHAEGVIHHWVIDGAVQWLITAAAAFRREALERVGGFNLDFPRAGEDVDLSMRLLEHGHHLELVSAAVVRHDHRSKFGELLRTFHLYGTAYRLLASRHTAYRADRKRSVRLRLSPVEWVRVYRRYRTQASVRRSLAFLALHAIVVIPYGFGILAGAAPRVERRRALPEVQLLGRVQSPDIESVAAAVAVPELRTAERASPAA